MQFVIMFILPAVVAIVLGIALAFTKRLGLVTFFLFVIGLLISVIIFGTLPKYIRDGGPLVILLILLLILLVTFIIERLLTLRKARGSRPFPQFFSEFRDYIRKGDLKAALEACNNQRGSTANILRAGLERFLRTSEENMTKEKRIAETQRAVEEANMLETPLLERNLIALTTIASIATMVGLLGTTIGMIRAFRAMAHAGAPDAIQLAVGISEALINTAGGLINGIGGIVSNNYFSNRVDAFNYQTDEAVYETVQILSTLEK